MSTVPFSVPTIRRRLAGLFYEALLLVGVLFGGFLLPQAALGVGLHLALSGGWLYLHILILLGVYFLWNWHRTGRTLPMQTWKIRLVSADGGKPTLKQLMVRYLAAWPSILLLGIGLAWALFDRDRQFLHDRLAGTRLVTA